MRLLLILEKKKPSKRSDRPVKLWPLLVALDAPTQVGSIM